MTMIAQSPSLPSPSVQARRPQRILPFALPRLSGNAWAIIIGGTVYTVLAQMILRGREVVLDFNPTYLMQSSLPVQVHVGAAVTAFFIGAVLMLGVKGRGMHKSLGWAWVLAMATTALSSLFMTGVNGSWYSFIHMLSAWTLISLPIAVFAVRRRQVAKHRKMMTDMYFQAMLVAGLFTFLPYRLMWDTFFSFA